MAAPISSYTTYARPPYAGQAPALLTFRDLIDRILLFANAGAQSTQFIEYRMAIEEAYRWVVFKRPWKYFFKKAEILFSAPYSTGTITYDHTGGASERLVTFSDTGNVPTWAIYGHLEIDGVFYEIESNPTTSTVTLPINSNPGADVAAGTSFNLYRSVYPLPPDFRKTHDPQNSSGLWASTYISPEEWYSFERHLRSESTPFRWTIMRDPKLFANWAAYFYPHPGSATSFGILYQGTGRPLVVSGYESADYTGTLAISGTTVTGTTTAFTAADVGAVLRVSASTSLTSGVDGLFGPNRYTEQAIIASYSSATSVTIDRALTGTYSGVNFSKSDPVDLPETMLEAVLARARMVYLKNKPVQGVNWRDYERLANEALIQAMENDVQQIGPREVGYWYDRMLTDIAV